MNKRMHYRLRKKIICLDFDGVIHNHLSSWKDVHIIEGIPTNGAVETISRLMGKYTVIVYSGRCREQKGIDAIREWLDKHNIIVSDISDHKPLADYYVDDKAVQFNGDWNKVAKDIESFTHWQKLTKKLLNKRRTTSKRIG